jgi:unsaturated chondroitin disaccharide hydrolase
LKIDVTRELRDEVTAVHDWACEQIARTASRLEGGREFPHVTDDGRWRTWPADVYAGWDGDNWSHGNWTCGFWVGLLWLAFLRTGDTRFEGWARYFGDLVAPRQHDENTHDIGFISYPSFSLGHWVTGDEDLKEPAVQAARTLATRFNRRGKYLQAWGPLDHPLAKASTAIDTMMNLPLLWWASRATEEPEFADVARAHAATSARYYLRPDGSTYHIYSFDPDTGEGIEGGTYQGANPDSTWSRGVTWGIYGWALAYREHRDPVFLQAAERAAEYFVGALPGDLVPPWDFADRDPVAPKDSSATAICANAFLELGELHPDPLRRAYYHNLAEAMLASLCDGYLGRGKEGEEGILLHSAYSVPHNDGVDSSVMWGEWFFVRAVSSLTTRSIPIP